MQQFVPVTEHPVFIDGKEALDYKAITNADNGMIFGITSNRYQLMSHEQGINAVEEVLKDKEEFGKYSKNLWLSQDGKKMQCAYTFDDIEHRTKDGEIVKPSIYMKHGYCGTPFTMMFGGFRVVCANGLVIGDKFAHYRRKHTEDINIEVIMATLDQGMNRYAKLTKLWDKWLDENTNSTEMEKAVGIFNDTEREYLVEVEEAQSKDKISNHASFFSERTEDDREVLRCNTNNGMNKWIFYNILTQFISHSITSRQKQAQYSQKIAKQFYK